MCRSGRASRSARRSGREQKNTDWSDRLHRFADAAAARSRRLKLQSARVYHRVHSATAGKPKLGPLSFLALSLVIGLASVVGVVYTPAYVVSVDGVGPGPGEGAPGLRAGHGPGGGPRLQHSGL